MKDYIKENDGYGFFLLVIDGFSKQVYTRPIKQLTGNNIKRAFQSISIFEQTNQQPMHLRTDKGSEFSNGTLKTYLKKKG